MKKQFQGLILLGSLIGILGASSVVDTYPRQWGIDALNYTFQITFRDDTDRIEGEATVDFRFIQDNVKEFTLDLISVSPELDGKGMAVSKVMSDGVPLGWTHKNDRLHVTLSKPSVRGKRRQFTVYYEGEAADGLKVGLNRHGDRTFFSVNWPNKARQWLPMIDHPYDKATSEFIITAPSHYQVVANGLLQEETDLGDGQRITHWKQSVPIASWLNAVGVARFTSRTFGFVNGIPLQTWVFPQDREMGIATFEVPVRNAIEFFSSHIGQYPYEKLGNVQAAGMGGGMEHASAIFYGERNVTDRPATGLVAHEIAHQWFGNSVTESDWDDVWLSEGFATYFTLLATEHYQGRDALVEGLGRARERVFSTENRMPGVTIVHDNLDDMKLVLSALQYQKGGWVLHMLRGQIGTENFWDGIRDYYAIYRDSNASSADLQKIMEEVSGQELSWFFDQWLRRAPSPEVEGFWSYDPLSGRIVIELTQTQDGDPYRLPLEVDIQVVKSETQPAVSGDSQRRRSDPSPPPDKIEMTSKSQSFEIAVESEPDMVTIDPNTWILMRLNFERQ
tara:strand:+ start:8807 stop:10492 length:1686 start_codon:yes stop_codon:yes gene_type:complete